MFKQEAGDYYPPLVFLSHPIKQNFTYLLKSRIAVFLRIYILFIQKNGG